jgi:hypothetical protein
VQFLVAKLKQLPDLAETCTLAAELAQESLLPQPSGSRVRKAEFLKRCQAALAIKNPLAELDVKKLPGEDQRAIALALEPCKKICSKCPNPANTALEFSLDWSEVPSFACSCKEEVVCKCVVPEPDPRVEWYCAGCALELQEVVCPICKNGETLPAINSPQYLLASQQLMNARCTKCSRRTKVPSNAHPSSKNKRKYNETLDGLSHGMVIEFNTITTGHKRACLRTMTHGMVGGRACNADGDDKGVVANGVVVGQWW